MEILRYHAPNGNFGDDLNDLIWPALLPEDVRSRPDIVLAGIGTILNTDHVGQAMNLEASAKRRVFVLGSGAGNGPLPSGYQDFDYLAVRGPLTAALVGRPESAVTDGAALLAVVPGIRVPTPNNDAVLFMPHHYSVPNSRWADVAQRAGCEYVDPCWSVSRILEAFAGARLVITEALHGAIAADTLRIPWIAACTSPAINSFKWRDWTASMAVAFNPAMLPASSVLDQIRRLRLRQRDRHGGKAEMAEWQSPSAQPLPIWPPIKTALKRLTSLGDEAMIDKAARALGQLIDGPGRLSNDAVFADRLARLQEAVHHLIKTVRAC